MEVYNECYFRYRFVVDFFGGDLLSCISATRKKAEGTCFYPRSDFFLCDKLVLCHIIPFMTAKPVLSERNFVRNIPDTLTNNMQELLVLMAAMIFLYTMIKFCFQLKEWVKGAYSDAITNCAAFFLYHLSILAVCFVVIPAFGYGQLFLFNDYTSADIMVSIQELISAFRTDGMNILYLSYKFYSVFFLMTVIGIFATRFAKKRETNKETVSLTK